MATKIIHTHATETWYFSAVHKGLRCTKGNTHEVQSSLSGFFVFLPRWKGSREFVTVQS